MARPDSHGSAARRGVSLAYLSVAIVALLAVCSLAVDVGRVHMVRGELQHAADAAARHAAKALGDGQQQSQVIQSAVQAAGDNSADGRKVVVDRPDVELGRWDATARQFKPGETPADAVRVTARRTAATNNPVPLMFGQVVGMAAFDVTARAVAQCAARPLGIIGIDSIDMGSHALTDSYDSSAGPYVAAAAGSRGSISTNGDIDLSGTVTIRGDARPGRGNRLSLGPGVVVTGSTAPLDSRISFDAVSAGAAATTNDNANIPSNFLSGGGLVLGGSDVLRLPSGTYYLTGLSVSGSGVLEMLGPVTMYVAGDVTLADGAQTWAQRPTYLDLRVVGSGTVNIATGGNVHAVVYAPQGRVLVGGSGQLFGSIIGRSLRVTAHGGIHFDESLGTHGGSVAVVD